MKVTWIWCFAVQVYFPTYCFTSDRNLPWQSCQALGNCLCSLAAAGALAHSLMLLLSALCSRQDTTCIQHFFSFSNLMHVYTYIYVTMQMYCPLTLCLSGDGQGPFHSFTCPIFSLSSQEMLFFFFPLAPSHYISLPLAYGCFWFWQIKLGCQSHASLLYPLAVLPVTGPGALCHSVKQYNNLLFWSDVAWGRSYIGRKTVISLQNIAVCWNCACIMVKKKNKIKSLGLRLFQLNLGGNTASSKGLF